MATESYPVLAPAAEREPHTSCETDRFPSRLPTEDELREALDTLNEPAEKFLSIWWKVSRIARAEGVDDEPELALVQGDEVPTRTHVGALWVFTREANSRLKEIADTLNANKWERLLDDLAFVGDLYGEHGEFVGGGDDA